MPGIRYSFETVGNSSYLVATFEGGEGIINYQLQMLTNNEIRNIIKAHKRQKNDDVIISYNITSKISLAQIDSKNKIPKQGLISIIEGALNALDDIEEYQLVSSGIVFDEEYVYIKPGKYEPSFIYTPNSTEDCGIESLKEFVLSLIMGSKVEMTNDNFVQTLLDTLNKPALSADELKKLCVNLKNNKSMGGSAKSQQPRQVTPPSSQPPVIPKVQIPSQGADSENAPQKPPILNIPDDKGKKIEKANKKKNSETNKKSKEAAPKKNIFLIIQIALLAVLVAASFSGVLNDENGGINIQYLLGIILVLGCADFILYREMFKNNKEKGTEEKEKKKNLAAKKTPNKPLVSMPGKDIPSKPATTKPESSIPPVRPNNVSAQPQSQPQPEPQAAAHVVPQPAYTPAKPVQPVYDPYSGFESEDTVVLDDDNADGAYLEYFENGLSMKIKLNKESVLVGKLRGQCDYVISNNKISKMHAEFITRGTEHFVKDYNSTNGTYINGATQRISSNTEYPIVNGDKITLANIDMIFRC